jgi:DNA-binding transcriptional LysR family regulator
MELRQLDMFIAVADHGGFTAAARRLGVVQSAVSAAVRSLEDELGQDLFARTTRRVELTDAGHALLPEARHALAAVSAARDAVDAVRGGLRGTVRLATMHARVLRPIRLPKLLARFRADHPDVEIRLLHGPPSTEKVRQIRDGHLDLALVGLAPPPPVGVTFVPLRTETMQLLCHRDHPLAHRRELALTDVVDETFVDGPPGSASRGITDFAFSAVGLARTVAYESNDTAGMIDLVAEGLAVAILPPSTVDPGDHIACVPLRDPAPVFHVSLALPTSRPLGAAARALAARIKTDSEASSALRHQSESDSDRRR